MVFFITFDANWDARLDKVLHTLNQFDKFFYARNYGSSMETLSIVLMCRNPEHNFKQRMRFSKVEKRLSTDIMLDYDQFKAIDQAAKEKIVAQKLITEVPAIIAKYKFKDFDLPRFVADMKMMLKKNQWL